MTSNADSRFPNLVLMRMAHSDLLRMVARDGAEGRREEILKFRQTGAATGAIRDSPADRDVAQGLLDYWRATLYTVMRERLIAARPGAEGDSPPFRLAHAVLADFDEAAAHQLANAAELTV